MSLKHILICDFDETITRKDTISLLAKLPYKRPTARELPPWTHFTQNYMKAYELYAKPNTRCLPLIPQDVLNFRHKIMKSNYKDLFSEEFAYQKQARKVELASIEELEKYKLFQGITANNVKQYVGSLQKEQIRPGFTEVWRNTDEQYVLSINWSREFIRDVLAEKELQVNEENIYCNNLLISDDGSYTGMFDKGIMTGSTPKTNQIHQKSTKLRKARMFRIMRTLKEIWCTTCASPITFLRVLAVFLLMPKFSHRLHILKN